METYWEELNPFKSQSLKIAYWQTDLPLKEFCTVEPPSSLHWGPVLKDINSINLHVKTCQRYPPTISCSQMQDSRLCCQAYWLSRCVFITNPKRHYKNVEGLKATYDSHYLTWKHQNPLGSTIYQYKLRMRCLLYISISGRIWEEKKQKVYIHLNKTLLFTMEKEKKKRFLKL